MASSLAPAWRRATALQHLQCPHVVRTVLAVLNVLPRRSLRRSFAGGAMHPGPQQRSQVHSPEALHVDQDGPLLRDNCKQSPQGVREFFRCRIFFVLCCAERWSAPAHPPVAK